MRNLRGMSVQERNNQNQEILLNSDGEPVVLVRRTRTGIRCDCFIPASEYADDRCPRCFGTGFVMGYEQYFNPRRSDGRIMIRPSPAQEKVKMMDGGYESDMMLDCWTLTVPTIKDRDFFIRFDEDGNEEFRYEVLNVTRNKLLNNLQGGQKFQAQRVRKTDPIYQVRVFKNTSLQPGKIFTSATSIPGIPSHTHSIVINENVTNINQINQVTSTSNGHRHLCIDGVLQEALGHSHTITIV